MKSNIEQNLLFDLTQLIEQAQRKVVKQINSSVSMLFWQVGKRISEHILQNQRAEYGKEIVVTLSRELKNKPGTRKQSNRLNIMRRNKQGANRVNADAQRWYYGCGILDRTST